MSHAEHVLKALEMQRCVACGMPVGKQARGLTLCWTCAFKDLTPSLGVLAAARS